MGWPLQCSELDKVVKSGSHLTRPSLSLSHSLTYSLTTFSLSLSRIHSPSLSLSHTHTHTHTYSLSLSPAGEDAVQVAAALFHRAGEEGETDSLYTYAQLLRTGQITLSLSLSLK